MSMWISVLVDYNVGMIEKIHGFHQKCFLKKSMIIVGPGLNNIESDHYSVFSVIANHEFFLREGPEDEGMHYV